MNMPLSVCFVLCIYSSIYRIYVHTNHVWPSRGVAGTSHYAAIQIPSEEGREDVSEKKQTSHMLFISGLQHTVLICVPWNTPFHSAWQSASLSQSFLLWADRWEPQSPEKGSLITLKPGYIMRDMSGGGGGRGVEQEPVRFAVCCSGWSEGELRKWSKPRLSL